MQQTKGVIEKLNGDVTFAGPDSFKDNFEKVDWDKVWEDGFWSKLNNLQGETCADLAMNMIFTLCIGAPAELINKYYQQKKEVEKKNKEIQKRNREDYITNELKDQQISKSTIAAEVAKKFLRHMATPDACLKGFNLDDPNIEKQLTTKLQKDAYKRYQLFKKLPKTKEGEIDWVKLHSKEFKKEFKEYQKYMAEFIVQPECYNYIANRYRLHPNKDDLDQLLDLAAGMGPSLKEALNENQEKGNEEERGEKTGDTKDELEFMLPKEKLSKLAHRTIDFIEEKNKDALKEFPKTKDGHINYGLLNDEQKAEINGRIAGYLMTPEMKQEIANLLGKEVTPEILIQTANAVSSYIFDGGLEAERLEQNRLFSKASAYIRSGDNKALAALLAGMDINHQLSETGETLLMRAVKGFKDKDGNTEPLNKEAIEMLINLGANLDLEDENGQTVLDLAEENQDVQGMSDVISLLKSKGAKNGPKKQQGRPSGAPQPAPRPATPNPHIEAQRQKDALNMQLRVACGKGNWKAAEDLIKQGADVNGFSPEKGQTPLMFAAFNGHANVVDKLIENGADVTQKDARGASALDYVNSAVKKGRIPQEAGNQIIESIKATQSKEPELEKVDETIVVPQPEKVTPQPENATPQPENATPQPENGTPQQENATPQPENATPQPENGTAQPENGTAQPENEVGETIVVPQQETTVEEQETPPATEQESGGHWADQEMGMIDPVTGQRIPLDPSGMPVFEGEEQETPPATEPKGEEKGEENKQNQGQDQTNPQDKEQQQGSVDVKFENIPNPDKYTIKEDGSVLVYDGYDHQNPQAKQNEEQKGMPESIGGIDGATIEATSTAGAQATATAEAHAEAGVNVEIKNNGNSPVGKGGASRAGGGSNGNGGAPGQNEGVQVKVDATAKARAEAKMESLIGADGKIIIDKLKRSDFAEIKLMNDVLEGNPLSREQSAQLAGIMSEMGVQGDIDKESKGHTGAIGRLEIDFAKERAEGEQVKQVVSDEIRKAIVDLYIHGSLDDFVLTGTAKKGASKSGQMSDKEWRQQQIKIVATARAKRKEIEALARKNQELQEKKRYLEYIRRRSNEQSQARSQQRADAARKNLNDYSH